MTQSSKGPLSGIVVIDLSRILAGPYCTLLMAEMGARVIKVEPPKGGDDARAYGPFVNGKSTYFASVNRGKESIALDLKAEADRKIFKKLLEKADVVVENFRPGTMEKLGFGWDTLHKKYPKLIYASASGFGHTGPNSRDPAYDMVVQGMGGIMSITGPDRGEPAKVGVGIADVMTGMYSNIAILSALRHRDATGQGQHIDIGMLDTHVAWLANQGSNFLSTGENPPRLGNQHPNIAPYQEFPSKDGYLILAVGNDPTFERFCKNFGQEHLLADERFATNPKRVENRQLVTDTLTPLMKSKTTAEWIKELEALKIACGPINTLKDVFSDPHVIARNMVLEMDHASGARVKVTANPVKLSATPPSYRSAAPVLGQHNQEVLQGILGMSEAEVAALKDKGII
jgi:crotonobetainyl-CoA:carnitine CoA-transferase CaiB-like acyl-CoA transferase